MSTRRIRRRELLDKDSMCRRPESRPGQPGCRRWESDSNKCAAVCSKHLPAHSLPKRRGEEQRSKMQKVLTVNQYRTKTIGRNSEAAGSKVGIQAGPLFYPECRSRRQSRIALRSNSTSGSIANFISCNLSAGASSSSRLKLSGVATNSRILRRVPRRDRWSGHRYPFAIPLGKQANRAHLIKPARDKRVPVEIESPSNLSKSRPLRIPNRQTQSSCSSPMRCIPNEPDCSMRACVKWCLATAIVTRGRSRTNETREIYVAIKPDRRSPAWAVISHSSRSKRSNI